LFEKKQYLPAERAYSAGIKQHPSTAHNYLLYLNRAQVYILLERYSACLQDCNTILPYLRQSCDILKNGKVMLEKVLYRRALSLYSLRRWEAAHDAYSELHLLNPRIEYTTNIDRTKQRITESTTGKYNILKLKRESLKSPFMDVADFYGSIEVVKMAADRGGGRGVRTTKDVEPGEILLANKAISYGTADMKRMIISFNMETNIADTISDFALRRNVIYKLCDQPELARSIYALYAGPNRKSDQVITSSPLQSK
jgi:tetratricopeptide (TPR) repeat protein